MNELIIWIAKSLVIVAIVAGGLGLLKRSVSASQAAKVWLVTLGAILLLPVVSHYFPQTLSLPFSLEMPKKAAVTETAQPSVATAQINEEVGYTVSTTGVQGEAQVARFWFIAIWGGGALLLVGRLLLAARALGKLRKSGEPAPENLQNAFQKTLGDTELIFCKSGISPQSFGILKPVIVLPEDAKALPSPKLRSILRHEMGHINSCDPFTILVGELICALAWINPALWICKAMLRNKQELAADDYAVSVGSDRIVYAEMLLEVAVSGNCQPLAAAIKSKQTNSLEARIRRVLETGKRRQLSGKASAFLSIVSAVAFIGLAAMTVNAENNEEIKTLVILDIGHGGLDKGAVANGVSERPLNEKLAKIVKERLIRAGYSVAIVAADDELLNLSERAEQIEALSKKAAGGAVLISLHHNSHRDPNTKGLEVMVAGKLSPRIAESMILANGFKNAYEAPVKIRNADFKLLRTTSIPAMFIEAGYLTNKQEARVAQTRAFRTEIAEGVVGAIAAIEMKRPIQIDMKTFLKGAGLGFSADSVVWSKGKKSGIFSGGVEIDDEKTALAAKPILLVPSGETASISTGTVEDEKEDIFKATFIPTRLDNGDIKLEYSILDGKSVTETLTPWDDVLVIQHKYLGGLEATSVIRLSK